jgi:hypothetical protein
LPTQVLTPCRVGDADLKPVVYPNPSSADFIIGFSNADIQRSISIFDLNGQLIESLSASEKQLSFGENLIPGVYMVEIVGQQKIAPLKIVKIK